MALPCGIDCGMSILMPLPAEGFDPTESAIPWKVLSKEGKEVRFATPGGLPGIADPIMVTGKGLGLLSALLRANQDARQAYARMTADAKFQKPLQWEDLRASDFSALILPGGHAPGMREYLESTVLQNLVADFFRAGKPIGAICHGVVLACRSVDAKTGKSVLYGRKTTALLKSQEMAAWMLTRVWMGSYYRTYPTPVEDEVRASLQDPAHFLLGPTPMKRDTEANTAGSFTVSDGSYVSARWPGDAHKFTHDFLKILS